jgi:hypothetical protein
VLNSNNLKEFLMNLGLLLLSLLNLAFFSMIFAMIFGGLVLPVLGAGVILNIFDLDGGILKMDPSEPNMNPQPNQNPEPNQNPQQGHNPQPGQNPEPNHNPQNQPGFNNTQPEENQPRHISVIKTKCKFYSSPYNSGGDYCDMCVIERKLSIRMEDTDVKSTKNLISKFGKVHDLRSHEYELIRKSLNHTNTFDPNYAVLKHAGIEDEKLGPTGKKAAIGDFLKLSRKSGTLEYKYVSLTNSKSQLANCIDSIQCYHKDYLNEQRANPNP